MDIKARLTAPTPLWVGIATGVLGAIGGALGERLYQKRYNPGFKDDLGTVDMSAVRLRKELEESAAKYDRERAEVQSAFVSEMERMMDSFTAQLRTAAQLTEQRDREAIEEAEEERGRVSVFTTSHDEEGGDVWDYAAEMEKRSPDRPYIIHREEYDANEYDFPQSTLTYYAGDDVMVDERDKPIEPYLPLTGPLVFGHGSQDQSICFVRNEKMKCEWEILLDHGKYIVEVLGTEIEEELTHAHNRHATPKFRQE